jgi:tetratricopeptide (TPR) repeat protein
MRNFKFDIKYKKDRVMKNIKNPVFISLLLIAALFFNTNTSLSLQTAEQLFEKAIQLEEAKGELKKAIEVYQTIVNKFRDNRPIAAKAQLHIGMCYEKLGKQAAKMAYMKVIREFADQEEVVREARIRLSRITFNGLNQKIIMSLKFMWQAAAY